MARVDIDTTQPSVAVLVDAWQAVKGLPSAPDTLLLSRFHQTFRQAWYFRAWFSIYGV